MAVRHLKRKDGTSRDLVAFGVSMTPETRAALEHIAADRFGKGATNISPTIALLITEEMKRLEAAERAARPSLPPTGHRRTPA